MKKLVAVILAACIFSSVTIAIAQENESPDFQGSRWPYGKYQRSHLLAEEENPGERRGCGA